MNTFKKHIPNSKTHLRIAGILLFSLAFVKVIYGQEDIAYSKNFYPGENTPKTSTNNNLLIMARTRVENAETSKKQAENYYLQALEGYEKTGNYYILKDIAFELGQVYQSMGKHTAAIGQYLKAESYRKRTNLKPGGELYESIAKCYQAMFAFDESISFYQKSKNAYEATKNFTAKKVIQQEIDEFNKISKSISGMAITDYRKYNELERKYNELKLRQLQQIQATYNQNIETKNIRLEKDEIQKQRALEAELAQQKEKEQQSKIKLLAQEKQLQEKALELEKLQKQKQIDEKKRIEQEKAQERIYFGTGGTLLLLVIGLVFNGLRVTKSKSRQLYKKNIEISRQQEEIKTQANNIEIQKLALDKSYLKIRQSIQYAERIQSATLPQINQIHEIIPDSLIVYKPKDVVSGDFYWFSHPSYIDGRQLSFIVAADCTGHGVPGAFMSLIGNNLLHQIVDIYQITSPNKILEKLDEGINTILKQGTTKNKDGMDISICVVDHQKKIIEFAGARNPLIYIQNNEIHRINGDRLSIGGHIKRSKHAKDTFAPKRFTKHRIHIRENPASFYLFSDGYQDQFGGRKSGKFGIRRLMKLITEIHEEDMAVQKDIFSNTIDNWMQNEKQIDDILLIGFKVG